ncbi:hypothetical protein CONLIGDRAFT_694034 [Coniochaeta ligniaria NRRL 30616]|uniref:Uncharacterized protein n=1 Tax=Coniochaeta ligniaria NRRL 30616 TaxID=1408157 RepID=A0A1J7I6C9_9PEZI|nr:hypothetical protein CONLIGDRAFT_694034 [Coniochaeta ligniaria NRRL 30616]
MAARSMSPAEEHHLKLWSEIEPMVSAAGLAFLRAETNGEMANSDYNIIKKAIENGIGDIEKETASVYDHLASLALSAGIDPSDESPKAKQLRYLRWAATGRKDGTSPFASSEQAPKSPAPVTLRATCGNHKLFCTDTRRLYRAVSMFNEIFQHFLANTYQSRYRLTSIAVDQGMVVATTESDSSSIPEYTVGSVKQDYGCTETTVRFGSTQAEAAKWSTFPFELSNNRDVALAVLIFSRCNTPLGDARSLFELVIRPACKSTNRVVFDAKNMDLPVRIVDYNFNEFSAFHSHEVIRATLEYSTQYAIDPTGRQMGWKETMIPWDSYKNQRIHRIHLDEPVPPGKSGQVAMEQLLMEADAFNPRDNRAALLMDTVAGHMANGLGVPPSMKQGSPVRTIVGLLRLPDREFGLAKPAAEDAAKFDLELVAERMQDDQ